MLFSCQQPFLWGERCMTSQHKAAENTREDTTLTKKTCQKRFTHPNNEKQVFETLKLPGVKSSGSTPRKLS